VVGIDLHESAHALVGLWMGGSRIMVSSTGVEGSWSAFRNAGWVLYGVSGTFANAVLALGGWIVFRRSVGTRATAALVGWAFFAVNAWIATMYLIASPTFGFGDWMAVLDRFAARGPVRASAAITGLFIAGLLWQETGTSLARLVGNGSVEDRTRRAAVLTRVIWLASGVIAIAGGLYAPAGWARGAAIGMGTTLGSTWPILLAARRVGEKPVPGTPLEIPRSPGVIVAGAIAASGFIALLGPGLRID
jgi:hypothetical protein